MTLAALTLGVTTMLGFAYTTDASTYEVKTGDTLYKIAQENQLTVDQLKQLNHLRSTLIFPGQTIQLTNREAPTYEVKKGDTLYSIARTHQMTVTNLMQLNALKSTIIYPGQKLNVNALYSSTYQVKKGDTLYSISKKFQMSVAELKELNGLTNNTIFLGQSLKVQILVTHYEVEKGDTLYSISKKFNMEVAQVKELNQLTSETIYPSQKLIVHFTEKPESNEIKIVTEKGYRFVKEEPGKYQLFSERDGHFYVRIEPLGHHKNLKELKKQAEVYLKSLGNVKEVKEVKNLHDFYQGAKVYFTSSNSTVRQSIVIKEINGQLVRFTIHLPDKEEAEEITPALLKQLQTLNF